MYLCEAGGGMEDAATIVRQGRAAMYVCLGLFYHQCAPTLTSLAAAHTRGPDRTRRPMRCETLWP